MTKNAHRLRLTAGVGALAVLVAVVIGVALTGPVPGTIGAAGTSPAPSAHPSATATEDGAAGLPSSTAPSSLPTSAPGAGVDGTVGPDGVSPDAGQDTPPEPATEVPPAVDGPGQSGSALPPSTPIPALLTGPVPDSATAENEIVAGFPTGIPVVDRSTVSSSDVSVENERVRASLTATTPTAGQKVLALYDAALAGYGFNSAESPAVGGSTAREYSRGAESVTVTVTPTATGGSGYTILALLVVAG